MDIMQAMRERHSVRRYQEKAIEPEKIKELQAAINNINENTGLNIQLITDEPEAFTGTMAAYGHFSGCSNYIAICSENGRNEEIGYYGEELVLLCQMLGTGLLPSVSEARRLLTQSALTVTILPE